MERHVGATGRKTATSDVSIGSQNSDSPGCFGNTWSQRLFQHTETGTHPRKKTFTNRPIIKGFLS